MSKRIHNHLRRHRCRSGLSQREIAFLLGNADRSVASRHEECLRRPNLATALAYQVIHGVSVSDLFPGLYEIVEADVERRASALHGVARLPPQTNTQRAKVAALKRIVGSRRRDRSTTDGAR